MVTRLVRLLPLLVMIVVVAACSSQAAESAAAPAPATSSPVALSPSAAAATPTPTSKPAATPPPVPATVAVFFTGLRAGVYPTHLHSRCSGSQQFHILVLPSVVVGAAGTGMIAVPRGYFGRGLCVIVYASRAVTSVVATRRL